MSVATARRSRAPASLLIRLPDLPTVPSASRGKQWKVQALLSEGETNTKLALSNVSSLTHGYRTFGLTLAPAESSGYQLCASASPGCRSVCLHYQGRSRVWPSIIASRIAKAIAFMEHRDWFEARLQWELDSVVRRTNAAGLVPAVRLNVLSDIMWERVFPWLFERYRTDEVVLYDYSKHRKRMLDACRGRFPANYHLTFSRSECNERACLEVLRAGGNVAVVFRGEPPPSWRGFPVVSGDEDDMRFLDPKNVVIGLKAKGTARHDRSGFVVELPMVT